MTVIAHTSAGTSRATKPGRTPSTRQRTQANQVPKLRYIVVLLAGIFAILGGQLLLSIAVSGGAYEIASLKSELRGSHQKQQIVSEEISALVAPDTLANLASSLGMVPDNNPAYIRVSDGAVLGEAIPALASSGGQVFAVTAGTETLVAPAIVEDVFVTISTSMIQGTDEAGALAFDVEEPTFGDTQGPVVSPVSLSEAPAPRFGGSIPSPVTR